MKAYENISRIYLTKRLPVIIRIDGRAFHTLTRGFARPFDELLGDSMVETAVALCAQISGTKLAYVQSDEISLLLTNDDTLVTEPWFGNNLQKLTSISASIATLEFNKSFKDYYTLWCKNANGSEWNRQHIKNYTELSSAYTHALMNATFDSRAFVLPPSEVVNYFIWRQQDATRNSVQMVAQSLYPHGELQNKNTSELQEMIFQKGVNWDGLPVRFKRGVCCVKDCMAETITLPDGTQKIVQKSVWMRDFAIPIFTQDRSYIENRMQVRE